MDRFAIYLMVLIWVLHCALVSFAAPPAESYLLEVANKIQKHYVPAGPATTYSTNWYASFVVSCTGAVTNISISSGPHYEHMDESDDPGYKAAMRAVIAAEPLPLPPRVFQCPMHILIKFDEKGKTTANILKRTAVTGSLFKRLKSYKPDHK